jgi:hypothetical protein
MKKSKERNETREFKTLNTFLTLKTMFFGHENDGNGNSG